MKKRIVETFRPEETQKLGRELAKEAAPGTVITLNGDLGVGKTVFAQGIAMGLDLDEWINSPTFTIVQEYNGGRMPFYHFDVYRIADADEMYEIGYEDYFYGEGLCLIEWADLIRELIPKEHIRVCIEKDPGKGFDYRKITIEE